VAKKVIALRGLPASGKSTWAKQYIKDNPDKRVVVVNNDSLSESLFGVPFYKSNGIDVAGLLRNLRYSIVKNAVFSGANVIIIDNTNLGVFSKDELQTFTYFEFFEDYKVKLELEIVDFFDVSFEECCRRNNLRNNPVPEQVMKQMNANLQQIQEDEKGDK
jgi:predicted kinase